MLQLLSVLMVLYSYFLIETSIPKLPRLIPTHFNAAGVPNGWGSPQTLWFLFGAQVLTCAVFLAVPYIGLRHPQKVHLGSRRLSDFPPAQRARILPMLNLMGASLSLVTNLFFVYMLRQNIRAAMEPIPHSDARLPLLLLVAGTLAVVLYFTTRFSRAAKSSDDGNSPDA